MNEIGRSDASAEASSTKQEPCSGDDDSDSALIAALREWEAIAKKDPKAWQFPVSDEPFVFVSELERQANPFQTMFEEEPSMKILELIKGALLELGRRVLSERDESAAKAALHCLIQAASVAANEANAALNPRSQRAVLHEVAATYPALPVVLALTSRVPESVSVKSAANYLKKLKVGTQSVLKAGSIGKKENLNGSSLFSVGDVIDLSGFVAKLRTPQDPISSYLWNQFSASTQEVLTSVPEQQKSALVQALNNILKGVSIYETVRFAGVALSPQTLALKSQNPEGTDLIRLNRLLLEDAYPLEIAKSHLNTKQAHVAYLHARSLVERLAHLRRFASLVKPPDEDPVLRRLVKRLLPLIGTIPTGRDHAFGKWCKTAVRKIQETVRAPETDTHLLSLVQDLDGFSIAGTLEGEIRFRRGDQVLVYDLGQLRDLIWACLEQALYRWRNLLFTEMMHAVAQTSKPLHADKAALRTALLAMLHYYFPDPENDPQLRLLVAYQVKNWERKVGRHGGIYFQRGDNKLSASRLRERIYERIISRVFATLLNEL